MSADSAERQDVSEVPRYKLVRYCDEPEMDAHAGGDWVRYADVQPLLAELERLRGEVADLRRFHRWNIERDGEDLLICEGDHVRSEGCVPVRYVPASRAEAQVEAMRKDAERYRWLREHDNADLLAEDVIDEAIAALLAGASGGGGT